MIEMWSSIARALDGCICDNPSVDRRWFKAYPFLIASETALNTVFLTLNVVAVSSSSHSSSSCAVGCCTLPLGNSVALWCMCSERALTCVGQGPRVPQVSSSTLSGAPRSCVCAVGHCLDASLWCDQVEPSASWAFAFRFLPAHLALAACRALCLGGSIGVTVSSVSWALPDAEPMPSVGILVH